MNVNERNAQALASELTRLRTAILGHDQEISALKHEILGLRQEIAALRMMAASSLGRGPTHADR